MAIEKARAFVAELNVLIERLGVEFDDGGPEEGASVTVNGRRFGMTWHEGRLSLYDDVPRYIPPEPKHIPTLKELKRAGKC